jgi:hypothetical protein
MMGRQLRLSSILISIRSISIICIKALKLIRLPMTIVIGLNILIITITITITITIIIIITTIAIKIIILNKIGNYKEKVRMWYSRLLTRTIKISKYIFYIIRKT